MKKLLLFLTASIMLLTGACRTHAFAPTAEDELTKTEKYHLYDYARAFLFSSKKLKLTEAEKERIRQTDPELRIHYTAPKSGKMSMSWVVPGKAQVIVSAEGPLQLTHGNHAEWKLRTIKYSRKGSRLPSEFGIPEAGE